VRKGKDGHEHHDIRTSYGTFLNKYSVSKGGPVTSFSPSEPRVCPSSSCHTSCEYGGPSGTILPK